VWTSAKKLDGREFCSIFNSLIRDDALLTDDVADQVDRPTCVCARVYACVQHVSAWPCMHARTCVRVFVRRWVLVGVLVYVRTNAFVQAATLAHALNSNVVTRGNHTGDQPWPLGPKAGPSHNSTELNVCFRGTHVHS
jgi:hypothetical protein